MSLIGEVLDVARSNTSQGAAIIKVIGIPGAGKTHQVADYLLERNEQGYGWDEMLAVSFSRSAARAYRTRLKTFGVDDESVRNYKTIHATCYHLLDLRKGQVIRRRHVCDFLESEMLQHSFTGGGDDDSEEVDFIRYIEHGRLLGDRYLRADHLLRNTLGKIRPETLLAVFRDDGSVTLDSIKRFSRRFREYRGRENVLDFTDMLEQILDRELMPTIKALVVDEAQDLSALQARVIGMWAQAGDLRELTYLGDDAQCIYEWAGADLNWFLNGIRAKYTIALDRSHRLPSEILAKAEEVIAQNHRKLPRKAESHRVGGAVDLIPDPQAALDRALQQGEDAVYVLARSRALLAWHFKDRLDSLGIPYAFMGQAKSLWQGHLPRVVGMLMALRKGTGIAPPDLPTILNYIPSKGVLPHGVKAYASRMASLREQSFTVSDLNQGDWGNLGLVLTQTPLDQLLRLRVDDDNLKVIMSAAERQGPEVLMKEPRIWLGTKHASKGLEAKTVISLETEDLSGDDPDVEAERRVAYVARTRASERLILVPIESGF